MSMPSTPDRTASPSTPMSLGSSPPVSPAPNCPAYQAALVRHRLFDRLEEAHRPRLDINGYDAPRQPDEQILNLSTQKHDEPHPDPDADQDDKPGYREKADQPDVTPLVSPSTDRG